MSVWIPFTRRLLKSERPPRTGAPELGGPGNAANPEQLLAMAYSASFHSALIKELDNPFSEVLEILGERLRTWHGGAPKLQIVPVPRSSDAVNRLVRNQQLEQCYAPPSTNRCLHPRS